MSSLLMDAFYTNENGAKKETQARIAALLIFMEGINSLLANQLVKDKKHRLFLIKTLSKLSSRKEALELSLLTEDELHNLRVTAENFGKKAQSAVGGMRILHD